MKIQKVLFFKRVLFLLIIGGLMSSQLPGCSNVYYSIWEKLGKQKRDLLKDHIEESREDQKEVGEEFKDALERLQELVKVEGGALEEEYRKFKDEYEEADQAAGGLRDRIKKVEQVASDLFVEWEREIPQIKQREYREDSRKHLRKSKEKYKILHRTLKSTEKAMDPVLGKFKDVVLYLKHRLNAKSLDSLQGEFKGIEKDIGNLIRQMEKSISEGEQFIRTLETN